MGIGHAPGARYKKLVDVRGAGECWPWVGSINKKTGYGKKQWMGETWSAHRWVYTMLCGAIPRGMVVDHSCGNRACANPSHLRLVTQQENCRHGKGTKLTDDDVEEIRAMSIPHGQAQDVADRYGISRSYLYALRRGLHR